MFQNCKRPDGRAGDDHRAHHRCDLCLADDAGSRNGDACQWLCDAALASLPGAVVPGAPIGPQTATRAPHSYPAWPLAYGAI